MILKIGTVNELLLRNKEDLLRFTREQNLSCDLLLDVAKDFFDAGPDARNAVCEEHQELGASLRENTGRSGSGSLPVVSFDKQFNNRFSASSWAEDTLKGKLVAAVDGSQLGSSSLHGLPFGFVSCGWFLNHHEDSKFERESTLEMVLPDHEAGYVTDSSINFRRTYGELEKVRELIETLGQGLTRTMKNTQDKGNNDCHALVFFDGSLIFSFAEHVGETERKRYRQILTEIFSCSRKYGVAVVGFVDRSLARDVTTTLTLFRKRTGKVEQSSGSRDSWPLPVPDSILFKGILEEWGDRSPIFASLRRGVFTDDDSRVKRREEGRSGCGRNGKNEQILFCYLQTSMVSAPARIEFPGWVLDEGVADEMIAMILAQCVAGRGYPLALKKAHELAVIGSKDRGRILHSVVHFMKGAGIPVTASTKSLVKEK